MHCPSEAPGGWRRAHRHPGLRAGDEGVDWGLRRIGAQTQRTRSFPVGSMGLKVEAACRFVEATGQMTAIGRLDAAPALLDRAAGTIISP